MIHIASYIDADFIARLIRDELGYTETTAEIVEKNLDMIIKDPHQVVLVIDDEVGFIHVQLVDSLYSEPSARIISFAVDGKFQGQGFGKKLLQAAEDWVKEQGRDFIILSSSTYRHASHRFYEKQAYQATRQQKLFVKKISIKGN